MVRGLRIGLTGGIGSGKSTVSAMLTDRGALLVDTDAIARALTLAGGAAIAAVRDTFGAQVIAADGGMDRVRMRSLAFADASVKGRLEAILHPLIAAEAARQALTAPQRVTVFDVPLLVETGRWRSRVDRVLVVDCSEATQLARVQARSGWTREATLAVIAQQASRDARRAAADAVILNDGLNLDQLEQEVDALWGRWSEPVAA
jgi:dephospho-CoA kinase